MADPAPQVDHGIVPVMAAAGVALMPGEGPFVGQDQALEPLIRLGRPGHDHVLEPGSGKGPLRGIGYVCGGSRRSGSS